MGVFWGCFGTCLSEGRETHTTASSEHTFRCMVRACGHAGMHSVQKLGLNLVINLWTMRETSSPSSEECATERLCWAIQAWIVSVTVSHNQTWTHMLWNVETMSPGILERLNWLHADRLLRDTVKFLHAILCKEALTSLDTHPSYWAHSDNLLSLKAILIFLSTSWWHYRDKSYH